MPDTPTPNPLGDSLREAVGREVRKFVAEYCDPDPAWAERDKAEAELVDRLLALAERERRIEELQKDVEYLQQDDALARVEALEASLRQADEALQVVEQCTTHGGPHLADWLSLASIAKRGRQHIERALATIRSTTHE